MADVTKSIKASGGDYSTIDAWDLDLDDTGIYSSGDVAIGELYDEAYSISFQNISGGSVVGLTKRVLQGNSAELGDGTAGTGPRCVSTTGATNFLRLLYVDTDFTDFEIDGAGYAHQRMVIAESGVSIVLERLLVHDAYSDNGSSFWVLLGSGTDLKAMNVAVYDFAITGGTAEAIGAIYASAGTGEVHNCTVYKIANSTSGNVWGVVSVETCQNSVACNMTRSGGGGSDIQGTTTEQYNASEDSSASGTGSVSSITAANQFVSTVNGSEDFHPQDVDADIYEAGTDLVDTPTDVGIDLAQYDRDAAGTTWSIGAFDRLFKPVYQEGYRFRNDDGSESAATWIAAQDTAIDWPRSLTARLRVLTDGSEPETATRTLQYKRSDEAATEWRNV